MRAKMSVIRRASFMLATVVAGILCASAGAQISSTPASSAGDALTGDADRGGELYAAECRGCHAVSIAPSLRGLMDRPVASVATFAGYSDGLKAKGALTWSGANLDAFLAAPMDFAPGTLMTKAIPDPQARADVIAYLATLPPPRN